MSNEQERLAYTVEEAAALLSLSRAQIYRLLDSLELDSITIGRSRRITRRQLLTFIERLEARSLRHGLPILPDSCRRVQNGRGWTT